MRTLIHLMAALLPLDAALFLLTAPHEGASLLIFPSCILLAIVVDALPLRARHEPAAIVASLPFDLLLASLAGMQLANVAGLVWLVARTGPSWDAALGVVLVGASGGCSGIVVAHELIHRSHWAPRLLGRIILCSVLYEHFYTEHVRGHHLRVGTAADPATAQLGETFLQFYRRTVPAQFVSAWHLEARRLGDEHMRWQDPRLLRSRVVHGIAVQVATIAAIGCALGTWAVLVFVLQASYATRTPEVTNYFEHWGSRGAKLVSNLITRGIRSLGFLAMHLQVYPDTRTIICQPHSPISCCGSRSTAQSSPMGTWRCWFSRNFATVAFKN